MNWLGMDPGLTGAIAFVSDKGDLIECFDMPVFEIKGKKKIDVHQVGKIVGLYPDCRAIIEQVGAMPGQGVSSMFAFGFAAGVLHGVVGALGIPLDTVTPQKWKRHFGLTKDKGHARQLATRRWPSGPFSRVKDSGRAEAALLALYGLETSR